MYYPDLSQYSYGRDSAGLGAMNVGWLSAEHSFEQCEPSPEFLASLKRLAESPEQLFRGSHICEFCPPPREVLSPKGLRILEPAPGTTGNGEIRVRTSVGSILTAPVLIVHYVEVHHYAPPAVFVEAVLRACND